MRYLLGLIILLNATFTGAAPAWKSLTPTIVQPPGHSGTFGFVGYTSLCFDPTTLTDITFQSFLAPAETPPYNSTIYSNAPGKLVGINPTDTTHDTLKFLTPNNWYNQTPGGSPYLTIANSNFAASPTPPDVHASYGCSGGNIYLFGGLNQAIKDTINILAADVNTSTWVCKLQRILGAWTTLDVVNFVTSGGLPSPLSVATDYWIIKIDSTHVQFASSPANAAAGTAIHLTTQGTGTHRMLHSVLDTYHYQDLWKDSIATGTWTMLNPTGQWYKGVLATGGEVAFDDLRGVFLINHGRSSSGALAEYSWEYNPTTNAMRELPNSGNARSSLSPQISSANGMTFDRRQHKFIVFGDQDTSITSGPTAFEFMGNSYWSKDTSIDSAWVKKTPVSPRPKKREHQCTQYVPGVVSDSDVIVVSGGWGVAGDSLTDTWLYHRNANTWESLATQLPLKSKFAYCTYDRKQGVLITQLQTNWAQMTIGVADLVPPVITLNPSDITVTPPATATFTITATGTPTPTYQWQKNTVDIGGATSASYTTPATSSGDNGSTYRCVVTNAAGTATSTSATLTTLAAPAITTNPSNTTVTAPAAGTFSCAASGAPTPTFQWQKGGVDIGGATSTSYTTPATSLSDDGTTYRCVATNSQGTATSSSATLTVQTIPAFTTSPSNATVTAPGTATFTIVATGSPTPTYQWQKNGTNIGAATSASYTTPATVLGDDGNTYRCVATNAAGATTSSSGTLTVNTVPTISVQPANATVTAPATANFTVTAAGHPTPTYQWQVGGVNVSGGSGATSASYTTPATFYSDNGSVFTVVVTNAVGALTSNGATMTVNSAPQITGQPSSGTGYTGATYTFSVAAIGNATLTYQWKLAGSNIGGATSANYTTPILALSDNGGIYSVVVTNGLGSTTSNNATLTVIPPRTNHGRASVHRIGAGR